MHDGRPLSDRWRPLELEVSPGARVGIRVCDEPESYKIGEWAKGKYRLRLVFTVKHC